MDDASNLMNIGGHDIGVCSWSLEPADMADLVRMVRTLGLGHIQLALGGLLFLDDKRKYQELGALRESGIVITAGMIGFPGEDYSSIAVIRDTGGYAVEKEWPLRQQITLQAAKLAGELGIGQISTHIGFVPSSNQAGYQVMLKRLREVAAALAAVGIELLMETGQEQATELLQFLNDLGARNVHVNFDPANMILYGAGDPIEAIHTLGRHIRHVHVKDAVLSGQPGVTWGQEMAFGTGQVDAKAFLAALKQVGYAGPLVIEREAGIDRPGDVGRAIAALRDAEG